MKINKKTTLFSSLFTLLISAIIVLTLSGCQSDDSLLLDPDFGVAASSDTQDTALIPPEILDIIYPDRSLFVGETLTIATGWGVFRMSHFATMYMAENEGVTIRIIDFWEDYFDWATGRQEMNTKLLTDSAPILICSMLADPLNPQEAYLFFDWFPVMYADPDFNEADWFMNVFHAASVNGHLYEFPLAFNFDLVGLNNTAPELLDEWARRDSVTVNELLDLYDRFTFTPYLSCGFGPVWAGVYNINDFACMRTGEVDFGDEFINLITRMRNNMNPHGGIPRDNYELKRNTYLFDWLSSRTNFLFLNNDSAFINPKPIVNNRGELIVFFDNGFLLNANATPIEKALAWDFIKFITNTEHYIPSSGIDLLSWHSPNRALMRYTIEDSLHFFLQPFYGRMVLSEAEAIEYVVNQIAVLGEMPMRRHSDLPAILGNSKDGLIIEHIRQFEDGLVSAEDLAATLQSIVEVMFMEMGIR